MKLFLALFLALNLAAPAATTIEREFTCPLDQHRWKQRVETSGRAEALRLDSREMGRDVVQPPTLPQCPQCRFVLFDAELDADAIRRLKAFVSGPDYRTLAAKSTPHACLAGIQEFIAAPPFHTGYSYLRAAWAVEGADAQCRRLLGLALGHFTRALDQMKPGGRDYINLALICGELERRTEKWDAAATRFGALRPIIAAAEPKYEAIVAQQLGLIERRDSRPHIVGARPDAQPATVAKSATPKIGLRSEPKDAPKMPGPKPESVSKIPDLSLPFVTIAGVDDEPPAARPIIVRIPAANGDPAGPASADASPSIELQPVPAGLPEPEALPEPLPLKQPKPRITQKPKTSSKPKPALAPIGEAPPAAAASGKKKSKPKLIGAP